MDTIKNELVLLPSLKAFRNTSGALILTKKYLDGAAEFEKYWPGKVTSLVGIRDTQTTDMDPIEIDIESNHIGVELRPDSLNDLMKRLESASVILGFLSPYEYALTKACSQVSLPTVFTSEYSPETEKQIIDGSTRNQLLRWRRKLWVNWAEKRRLKILALAAGIQCSGYPTFKNYRHYNQNSLLFFDNRVSRENIISQEDLEQKLLRLRTGQPLRLTFGGRLIHMKGVMELVKVACELHELGTDFQLEIFGSGPLETELQTTIDNNDLGKKVKLCGVLGFETEWIPYLKENSDLFVCCHTQGDPSSTYPEVMSCGVPIAGYDNEAFKGVVDQSGSGWLSEMYQPRKLAKVISEIEYDRESICKAAEVARVFAEKHCFEETFKSRTEHLVEISTQS